MMEEVKKFQINAVINAQYSNVIYTQGGCGAAANETPIPFLPIGPSQNTSSTGLQFITGLIYGLAH